VSARRGGSHDGCTDGEDDRRDQEAALAAPKVTEGVSEEGTKEGACLVGRDKVARGRSLELSERGREGRQSECSSDKGRVIANHTGSKRGDRGEKPYAPVVDGRRRRPVLDSAHEAHLGKVRRMWWWWW